MEVDAVHITFGFLKLESSTQTSYTINWALRAGTPNALGATLASGSFNGFGLDVDPLKEYEFSCSATMTAGELYTFVLEPVDSGTQTGQVAVANVLLFGHSDSTWVGGDALGYFRDFSPYGTFSLSGFNRAYSIRFTKSGVTVLGLPARESYSFTATLVEEILATHLFATARHAMHFEAGGAAPEKADTPFPETEENSVPANFPITLTWDDPGAEEENAATSWDVYFGTDLVGPEFQATVSTMAWPIPENFHGLGTPYLNTLQGYEWRIDAKNSDGTTTGDVWEFTTSAVFGLGKAIEPTPADTATGISPTLESLNWQNGGGATSFDVYFGTVGNLSKIRTITATDTASFSAQTIQGGLLPVTGSTTHAWRIDAVNAFGTVTGDVWTFATSTLIRPINTASNMMATRRILLAAADDTIWYEE